MPAGYVPKPMLKGGTHVGAGTPVKTAEKRKVVKKREYIPLSVFLERRHGLTAEVLAQELERELPEERMAAGDGSGAPRMEKVVRTAHNTIDRRTLRTLESGGLYFVEERWPDGASARWHVYIQTGWDSEQLQEVLEWVGREGYGKDASLGRGRFRVRIEAAPTELFRYDGNRMMSLSHGSWTKNMKSARYRLTTHYGKLGAWLTGSRQYPFKQPLLLVRPGATFEPDGQGPFGALISGVATGAPEVVHNAWHLTIPYREEVR
jgi:CRISPR-associated protein Csm4